MTFAAALRKLRMLNSREIAAKLSVTTFDEDGIDEGKMIGIVDCALQYEMSTSAAAMARRPLVFIASRAKRD
jgi:hypothetical protein